MELRRVAGAMPKWLSDVLFALFLVAVFFVVSIYVLPRLGFQT